MTSYNNLHQRKPSTQLEYSEYAMNGRLEIDLRSPYPIQRALFLRRQHLLVANKLIWC